LDNLTPHILLQTFSPRLCPFLPMEYHDPK
jgi:hypothetical protein